MINLVLNKGGMGVSLSRQETVERLNPLLKQLVELNNSYVAFMNRTSSPDSVSGLEEHTRTLRADIGKVRESIYSAGGVAYMGVDLDPDSTETPEQDELARLEQAYLDVVTEEMKMDHQIRTLAVLTNLKNNSQSRLQSLTGTQRSGR